MRNRHNLFCFFAALFSICTVHATKPVIQAKTVTSFEGRQFHLACAGTETSEPTVLIDGGSGHSSVHYLSLVGQLSKHARVCAFDRPGYGQSSLVSIPRTPERNGIDIAFMLEAAGIRPPVIVVGHSLGGLNVLSFAARFRELVAGVLLVESAHPSQHEILPPIYSNAQRELAIQHWKNAALRSLGIESNLLDDSVRGYGATASQRILEAIAATGPSRSVAIASELESMTTASESLARDLRRPLTLPLVVLTASNSTRWYSPNGDPTLQRTWETMQQDLLKYSTCAEQVFSRQGHHALQLSDPGSIESALLRLRELHCEKAAVAPSS